MNKLLIVLLPLFAAAPALAQVRFTATNPQSPPPSGAAPVLVPGLYVNVIDGAIQVSNSGGSQVFSAGQFGFVPNPNVPPVVLPSNPGLQFVPPPVFNTGSGGPPPSGGGKTNTVDCEVR